MLRNHLKDAEQVVLKQIAAPQQWEDEVGGGRSWGVRKGSPGPPGLQGCSDLILRGREVGPWVHTLPLGSPLSPAEARGLSGSSKFPAWERPQLRPRGDFCLTPFQTSEAQAELARGWEGGGAPALAQQEEAGSPPVGDPVVGPPAQGQGGFITGPASAPKS